MPGFTPGQEPGLVDGVQVVVVVVEVVVLVVVEVEVEVLVGVVMRSCRKSSPHTILPYSTGGCSLQEELSYEVLSLTAKVFGGASLIREWTHSHDTG